MSFARVAQRQQHPIEIVVAKGATVRIIHRVGKFCDEMFECPNGAAEVPFGLEAIAGLTEQQGEVLLNVRQSRATFRAV